MFALPSKTCFILACSIVLNSNICACALNFTNYEPCSSLENKTGSCIPIYDCNPIVSTLLSKKPLSQDVVDVLKKMQCGFEGHIPKICCATEEIDYSILMNSSTIIKNNSKSALLPELDRCGYFQESRFFNYGRTEIDQYPWNALLGYRTGNVTKYYCGGALISKRYILTAAHCVYWKGNSELSSVRLGEYDTNADVPDLYNCKYLYFIDSDLECPDEVDIPIEKTIVHEQYNPNDPNHHFDIALIRLAQDVTFKSHIRPVCLPPLSKLEEDEKAEERPISISGWGITTKSQKFDLKYKSAMDLKDINECEKSPKYINKNLTLQSSQLCVKARKLHNSCIADEGAVLTAIVPNYSQYFNYFAIGISSFDMDQCSEDPDYLIFTKLKDYLPWIYNNLE